MLGNRPLIPQLPRRSPRCEVQSVIDANDTEGRKALSQHPIRNAFYEGICLGRNGRGIRGMSPGEPLHVLELGLFKMMIEGFYGMSLCS
jgi:hypothetical protein